MPQPSADQLPTNSGSCVRPTVCPYVIDPPNPIATVVRAAARAAASSEARGHNRATSVRLTSNPASIAPVSCPYCPRIPHAIAPASDPNTTAANPPRAPSREDSLRLPSIVSIAHHTATTAPLCHVPSTRPPRSPLSFCHLERSPSPLVIPSGAKRSRGICPRRSPSLGPHPPPAPTAPPVKSENPYWSEHATPK